MYEVFYDEGEKIYVHVNRVNEDLPNLWLIHGFTESANYFSSIFSSSLARSYNIYLPDLPGFGKTKYFPGHHRLLEIHKTITRLIHKYSPQGETCLLGHSLGGAIAVLVAAEKSVNIKMLLNVDGLVCEDAKKTSGLSYVNDFISPDDFKDFIVQRLRVKADNNLYIRRYVDNIKKTEARVLYDWAIVTQNILEKNKVYNQFLSLTCEKYFIFGSNSINASNIAAIRNTPFIHSIEIPDTDHWPMLEKPASFWAIIERLLFKTPESLHSVESPRKIKARL